MRTVAALLSVATLTASLGGCFPHNKKMRTYSQLAEGAAIVSGIGIEFIANSKTEANCDQMATPGMPNTGCHSTGTVLSGVGLALILVGLTGFIATISTAEDDKANTPLELKPAETAKPEVKLPPGVHPMPAAAPEAPAADPGAAPSGSAAPAAPAP